MVCGKHICGKGKRTHCRKEKSYVSTLFLKAVSLQKRTKLQNIPKGFLNCSKINVIFKF